MDPRRDVMVRLRRVACAIAPVTLILAGCAAVRPEPQPVTSAIEPAPIPVDLATIAWTLESGPLPSGLPDSAAAPGTARPYLSQPPSPPPVTTPPRPPGRSASGRTAIAAANRQARADSHADAFVGGVQLFAYEPGRVYEIWTAPLRVTLLTLAPGETVSAKAAGDTVRWQIGESASGAGSTTRAHVLIKPLQTGLETNLVLTTNQRVYMLALRSGASDAFNAAVAWDVEALDTAPAALAAIPQAAPPSINVEAVTPSGPLDALYRIEPQGRAPRWTPTAVFNDGIRTFITLPADVTVDDAPAVFVRDGDEAQLVNYRQAGNILIVDRVFDQAELRLGGRRPRIVLIRRHDGAPR